ncbi:MAG: cell division ATP-binding protein FtsE [Clostridia bacterium]|nr:cell division ATP-binding protein FtsE [Clostridia bacterium]
MIEFKEVSMKYKTNDVLALDHVSVRIDDGEFVFIVGASGAGKSSFLNVIMGQERVDSGTVIVGPYNLTKIKKKELPYLRRMLGIVFQDFRLIPKMTVYDNVAFALRVIGVGERIIRKRVRYVLRLVDLSAKAKCLPNQLSTGERQRVAIARALVNNPGVIIADEPTGNLDPVLSGEIMSLFDKINALGATVVVVTHDLELVHQFDHRIVTIENGRIISDVASNTAYQKIQAQREDIARKLASVPEHQPIPAPQPEVPVVVPTEAVEQTEEPTLLEQPAVDPSLSADEMIATLSSEMNAGAQQMQTSDEVSDAQVATEMFIVEEEAQVEQIVVIEEETEAQADGE